MIQIVIFSTFGRTIKGERQIYKNNLSLATSDVDSGAMHLQGVFVIGLCSLALSSQVEQILSQFQDSGDHGDYKYSYESGIESKSEQRTPDGRTIGRYSYIDTNGKIQKVEYSAGVDGFQVLTGPGSVNLPRNQFSPSHINQNGILEETPEVVAARNRHFAAHEAALRNSPRVSQQTHAPHPSFRGPDAIPVLNNLGILQDTPEVAAAKAHHAAAHAEVRKFLPTLPQQSLFDRTSAPRFSSLHDVDPAVFNFPRHNQGVTKFAEEIPRSALGETPEVAAARAAHLAFYSKVKSQLPDENGPKPQFAF